MTPTIFLPLPSPLLECRFVERPNRFVVRARSPEGEVLVAHMADPGRLRELLVADRRIWLRHAEHAHRKTRWSAVLVESPDGRRLISLNTTLPNRLILRALQQNALEEFRDWTLVRAEFPRGRSRLDFLLENRRGKQLALEVKSVTLVEDGVALFPDAVTARGTRHVRELHELQESPDWEAAVLFVLQRDDGDVIQPASAIDQDFARALAEARSAGVQVLGRRCRVTLERIVLGDPVPVRIQ